MFSTVERLSINAYKVQYAAMYPGYRSLVRSNLVSAFKELHETPIKHRGYRWAGAKRLIIIKLRAMQEIE